MGLSTPFVLALTDGNRIRSDVSAMVRGVQWSGNTSSVCRQLSFDLLQPLDDRNTTVIDTTLGGAAELLIDDQSVFYGHCLKRSRDSMSQFIPLTALDMGHNLKYNEVFRKVSSETPESVTASILSMVGLEVGELAQTGIPVTQNFLPGSYWEIIEKLYALATEKNGIKYEMRLIGRKFYVIEQKINTQTLLLQPGSNLIRCNTTEDATGVRNSIGIFDDNDKETGRYEDGTSAALYGVMQRALRASQYDDPETAAQQILKENGDLRTSLTCECTGSPKLMAGNTVVIREPRTETYGLFRIASDSHTWTRGVYTTKITIDLQELTDKDSAASLAAE